MATASIQGIGEVERKELFAAGLRAAVSTGVLIATYFGHRYSLRMIAQRRDKLVAYLSDPLLG